MSFTKIYRVSQTILNNFAKIYRVPEAGFLLIYTGCPRIFFGYDMQGDISQKIFTKIYMVSRRFVLRFRLSQRILLKYTGSPR